MGSMYTFTLFLHSWNRWLILIAGLLVIILALRGLISKKEYTPLQSKSLLVLISSLHLQLLVGLVLYFVLSPITIQALNDFGAAMKESTIRYWAVEHAFVNIIAIGLAQTGSILVKRKKSASDKNKQVLIWTGIAFLLILLIIPMGIMSVDRPWFRF